MERSSSRITRSSQNKLLDKKPEQLSWNVGITHPIKPRKGLNPTISVTSEILEEDKDPDIWEMYKQFDKRFFDGKIKSYTLQRTRTKKKAFGCTDYSKRVIRLCRTTLEGQKRSVLVRTLLHQMIHAYLDVMGEKRWDNSKHLENFKREKMRINSEGHCDIEDDSDVDWAMKQRFEKVFECNNCKKTIISTHSLPPKLRNFDWWDEHKNSCGGDFSLSDKASERRLECSTKTRS